MGAQFTRTDTGQLHLTKEGGHSARRIVHAADTTGAEISRTLVAATRSHPSIDVFENYMCMDLCIASCENVPHCFGIDALNLATGSVIRFVALTTMLATGGAGHLYPATTNPTVATGDGIAAAWRAGATISNMEFVQFHPTALYNPAEEGDRTFLISEAVRGEGGRLYNLKGERFMAYYDDRMELAPRDVVARAITDQMECHGDSHVWLDISHVDSAIVASHFPAIAAKCATLGIDITRDPIPVKPAQHYLCGGIQTGLLGETSIPGLFACGEVAHTGLHGANRLASNSLLEGLVFASRAVTPSLAHAEHAQYACVCELKDVASSGKPVAAVALSDRGRAWSARVRGMLKDSMWRAAGIQRSEEGLADGLVRLAAIESEVDAMRALQGSSREVQELRNLVTCGKLVMQSALARKESRGLHCRLDYPTSRDIFLSPTMLQRESVPVRRSDMFAKEVTAARSENRMIGV
jgi:L-aspartate oxidase